MAKKVTQKVRGKQIRVLLKLRDSLNPRMNDVKGMRIRSFVLECTLHIENDLDRALSRMLGLSHLTFKRLGLRFVDKIRFIEELIELDKESKHLLDMWRMIRNKLVHDLSANTYVRCFADLPEAGKFVERLANEHLPEKKPKDSIHHHGVKLLYAKALEVCQYIQVYASSIDATKFTGKYYTAKFKRVENKIPAVILRQGKRIIKAKRKSFETQEVLGMMNGLLDSIDRVFKQAERETWDDLHAEDFLNTEKEIAQLSKKAQRFKLLP